MEKDMIHKNLKVEPSHLICWILTWDAIMEWYGNSNNHASF